MTYGIIVCLYTSKIKFCNYKESKTETNTNKKQY